MILRAIARASEFARSYSKRIFHSEVATAYFNGNGCAELWLSMGAVEENRGDLLSVTTLKADANFDGTYEYTLTEGSDYWLYPDATARGAMRIDIIRDRTTAPQIGAWPRGRRTVQIVGKWGYSEITEAVVVNSTAVTGSLSSSSDTTLATSAAVDGVIDPGDTLFIESEQCTVLAVAATVVTVTRGVNGTTAASHTNAAVLLRRFPEDLERAVAKDASRHIWTAAQGYPSEGRTDTSSWPMIRDVLNDYRLVAV